MSLAVSTTVVFAGLFTSSWDRFGNLSVGTFNIRVSTLLFALALTLTLADMATRPSGGKHLHIVSLALIIPLVFGIMGMFSGDRSAAMNQLVVIVLGAVVPFFSIYLNLRTFGKADQMLTAFIWGGAFASWFGLYQLGAFYLGLPQVVSYRAEGGGLGRISSFSYEAAYFAYFLILIIAAMFARAALRNVPINRLHFGFFLLVLVLSNSRATVFTLLLLALLVWTRTTRDESRRKIWPIFVASGIIAIIAILAFQQFFVALGQRFLTIFDPTEQSSNAPRVNLYETAWRIAQDHLATGIGGGNLISYLPQYGLANAAGVTPNSVVANNAWLQALLDGGVVLLAIQLVFVVVAITTLYRKAIPATRLLTAGWISTLVVSSMLTSFYFNASLWAVLALAVGVAHVEITDKLRQPDEHLSSPADTLSRPRFERVSL